jgi:hypothetical protein
MELGRSTLWSQGTSQQDLLLVAVPAGKLQRVNQTLNGFLTIPPEIAGEWSLSSIIRLSAFEKASGQVVPLDDLGHAVKTWVLKNNFIFVPRYATSQT